MFIVLLCLASIFLVVIAILFAVNQSINQSSINPIRCNIHAPVRKEDGKIKNVLSMSLSNICVEKKENNKKESKWLSYRALPLAPPELDLVSKEEMPISSDFKNGSYVNVSNCSKCKSIESVPFCVDESKAQWKTSLCNIVVHSAFSKETCLSQLEDAQDDNDVIVSPSEINKNNGKNRANRKRGWQL